MNRFQLWTARLLGACLAVPLLATALSMAPELKAASSGEVAASGTYGHNRSAFVFISTTNGMSVTSYCQDTPWLCQYVQPRSSAQLRVSIAKPFWFADPWLVAAEADGRVLVAAVGQEGKYATTKLGVIWNTLICSGAFLCFCLIKPSQN